MEHVIAGQLVGREINVKEQAVQENMAVIALVMEAV
jgi:hypothetical protein